MQKRFIAFSIAVANIRTCFFRFQLVVPAPIPYTYRISSSTHSIHSPARASSGAFSIPCSPQTEEKSPRSFPTSTRNFRLSLRSDGEAGAVRQPVRSAFPLLRIRFIAKAMAIPKRQHRSRAGFLVAGKCRTDRASSKKIPQPQHAISTNRGLSPTTQLLLRDCPTPLARVRHSLEPTTLRASSPKVHRHSFLRSRSRVLR